MEEMPRARYVGRGASFTGFSGCSILPEPPHESVKVENPSQVKSDGDATLLALKMELGAMSQGRSKVYRSWKRQGNGSFPGTPGKE